MLTFWFSPHGRAARADYWYWLMLPAAVAGGIVALAGPPILGSSATATLMIAGFVVFSMSHTAMSIKRLHDQSLSGWYVLALAVPFGMAAAAIGSPSVLDVEELNRAEDHVKLALLGLFAAIFAPFAAVTHLIWFRMGKDGVNRYGRDPLYR